MTLRTLTPLYVCALYSIRASLVVVARVRIKIGLALDDLVLFVHDVTLLFLVAFSVVVAVVALDVGDGLDLALGEPVPARCGLPGE